MEDKEVKIDTEGIKLEQLLKWAEVTVTGGEAKLMIQNGLVKVNGQTERRRGRKLSVGDIVEVEDTGIFKIVSS